MADFKQPAGMTTVRYSKALREMALNIGIVYYEQKLEQIFNESLHSSMRYSVCTFRGGQKVAKSHSLALYST